MGKRLNDTSALVQARPNCDTTTSVRAIDNGFITRTSTYNQKTGEYKESEMYSPSEQGGGKSDGTSNALAEVKKYLS